MEKSGINSYPRTISINPKPSQKTGVYVHLLKGLRKGVKTFFLLRWLRRKSKIFMQLFHIRFLQQCWNNFHSCHLPHSTYGSPVLMSSAYLCQDRFHQLCLLGWLPVSHLHPRTFLPRGIRSSGPFVSAAMLLTLQLLAFPQPPQCRGRGRSQSQVQKKVKGPMELLAGG